MKRIADDFTVKNPEGIIKNIQSQGEELLKLFKDHDVPKLVVEKIDERLVELI